MHTHLCIKCKAQYTDKDPDPYYCPTCNEAKKKIAKTLDAKFANRPAEQPKTDLQVYEEISRQRGSKFINIKDLGITL